MFSFTISAFTLHCFPGITVRKITRLIALTCLPSPNLNYVLIGKYSVSFILFSVKFNMKLWKYCSLATVLVYTVSITAYLDASATSISDFDKFSVINTIFSS